jgi:hypothetical protein
MKYSLICTCALIVGVVTLSGLRWSMPVAAQNRSMAEVWALEDDYWRYVKAGDVESYVKLWHEQFIGWPCDQDHPKRKAAIGDWVRGEGQKDQSRINAYARGRTGLRLYCRRALPLHAG